MTSIDDNQATTPGPAFHRFPDFANRDRAVLNGNAGPGDIFQPLYRDGSASDTRSIADRRRSADDAKLESIRQNGYAKGLEAGRQAACQAANHLLAPQVEHFRQDLEHLATYQQRVADHASAHIIAMALAISQRIMGTDGQLTVDDLEPIRESLIEAICRHHQLQLRYHPDDLAGVGRLMDSQGAAQWESLHGLDISTDRSLVQGELHKRHHIDEGRSISRRVQTALQQVLQHIERQRPSA